MAQRNSPAKETREKRDDDYLAKYVPVHERIQQFHADHEEGCIQTALLTDPVDTETVVFKASVYRTPDDPRPTTGYARGLLEGAGEIDQSALCEVTETSAVGRALAFMGYEIERGIASQEEVKKAVEQRKRGEAQPASDFKDEKRDEELALYKEIRTLHKKLGVTKDAQKKELLENSGVAESFQDITSEQLGQYLAFLQGEALKQEE